MKTSSAKNKSRKLQKRVRDEILSAFSDLTEHDVKSTSMGVSGIDVQLSTKARDLVPFAIECKNQEKISIWSCLEQAQTNAKEEGMAPALVFSRNHTPEPWVAIPLNMFIYLLYLRAQHVKLV